MRRSSSRGVVALLLASSVALAGAATSTVPPGEWLLDQVKILSAPDMEGRASGAPGADRAARHVARMFQDAGVRPGGEGGTFLQSFTVPTGIRLGTVNVLDVTAPAAARLALGRDWLPLAVSADGAVDGEVVFVGYGITAPDLGYDDYRGIDARGKIALVLQREPRPDDPAGPFRKPDAYHYSQRSHKILNAREHGVRAVLLAPHPTAGTDALPTLTGITQPWGIVAAGVTRTVAERLVASSGRGLAAAADAIDRGLVPRSFDVPGTRVRLDVSLVRERGTAANVVGIVPGTDPQLAAEAIVVGAHYDHLGRGGEGSLAPDAVGAIHPGADDNASGTAAVMGLARAFAAVGRVPRTIVFVAFAGEELGLLGSSHYVWNPAVPIDRTVLMVNLDMVGRLRDGKLYVGGVDSGHGLRQVVEDAARGLGLSLELRGDPFAPSDHTTFYSAQRPVLFLFTGAHADYHRPSDTWEKLNPRGLERVTTLAARVITAVASLRTPPAYARIEATARGTGRGGYGPFFGVVPDFSEAERAGVTVSAVRPGSPAEKAGVRAGDRIVRFAGVAVKTLEDFTFALRGRRPGDHVDVTIVRDGQERDVRAVLEERR